MTIYPRLMAVLFLAAGYSCAVAQSPAPGDGASAVVSSAEPVELTAARAQYESRVKDLHEKVPNAIKLRTAKYAGDLKALEKQVATSGNLDALLSIRTEREAYDGGNITNGFDVADTKVPAAARQLRAAYDADMDKISKYAVSEEHDIGAAYEKQLAELERRLTIAGKLEAAILVRTEKLQMQGLLSQTAPAASGPVLSTGTSPSVIHDARIEPAPVSNGGDFGMNLPVTVAASHVPEEAAKLRIAYRAAVETATKARIGRYLADLRAQAEKDTHTAPPAHNEARRLEVQGADAAMDIPPENPSLPPEIAALRKNFEDECALITKPISNRYSALLRLLLRGATQGGNAVAALAIQDQLTLAAHESVILGRWHLRGRDFSRLFRSDGRYTQPRPMNEEDELKATWTVTGGKVVVRYADQKTETFSLPMDMHESRGVASAGQGCVLVKEY